MLRFVLACEGSFGEELHVPLGGILPREDELEKKVEKMLSSGCRRVRLLVEVYYVQEIKTWMR